MTEVIGTAIQIHLVFNNISSATFFSSDAIFSQKDDWIHFLLSFYLFESLLNVCYEPLLMQPTDFHLNGIMLYQTIDKKDAQAWRRQCRLFCSSHEVLLQLRWEKQGNFPSYNMENTDIFNS